eukprot:TRINITY_DN5525_c3_g2_i1.p1 TRINITY_DN5525_c3_g2~~TRINITY_DN5525_c3_g2_i1.p1  ORF type:complete len:553 (+),score=142.94 TRINITY_DN5525_c3_g2_i1:111-1769(+)
MGNLLRQRKSRKEYREHQSVRASQNEISFNESDLRDLQAILWNTFCVGADGKMSSRDAVESCIAAIRKECQMSGYIPPPPADLARRLLVDTIEREEEHSDTHVVHKLETENQVLSLLFEPYQQEEDEPFPDEAAGRQAVAGEKIKMEAVEVLLQWYVHSSDCAEMLELMSAQQRESPCGAAAAEAVGQTARSAAAQVDDDDTLQSFVWQGSQVLADIDSPRTADGSSAADGEEGPGTARSFAGSFAAALLSPATQRRRRASSAPSPPAPTTAIAAQVHAVFARANSALLTQLCYCLKAAMRAALREFSTAHFSRQDKEETRTDQWRAGPEWSANTRAALSRTDDLSQRDGLLLPSASEHCLTVVLDLDETLVYARRGPLWVRPGVHEFLRDLKRYGCEVICWTASNRSYAGGILSKLDPKAEIVSQCIYAHPKWQRTSVRHQIKNLRMLNRRLERTVIFDNLPDAVAANPENAVVVEDYEGCEMHGTTLPTASKLVQQCAQSRSATVPEFLHSVATGGADAALKCCERLLSTGEYKCFYVLNSEPEKFTIPL